MSTLSLRDLRNSLGTVVREVSFTGREAIITDNGKEVAAIISMADYERLHQHADAAAPGQRNRDELLDYFANLDDEQRGILATVRDTMW
jgi:prevent-host-death family protein